jgi:preprotein translocase subunit SecE
VAKGKKQASHRQRQQNAIQRYISETTGELRKVNWPTRKEAVNLTIVVVIVVIGMSIFLGSLDFIFSKFFQLIF